MRTRLLIGFVILQLFMPTFSDELAWVRVHLWP